MELNESRSVRGADDQGQAAGRRGLLPRRPWLRRIGLRLVLGAATLVAVGGLFSIILLLVEDKWAPMLRLDDHARDSLHSYALAHPTFTTVMQVVSNSGSALAWQVVAVVAAVVLLVRRRLLLALFVVVTIGGSSLINSFVKAAVNRARPVVPHPLLHEPGMSFPSGHAQAAVVGYSVVLTLVLPLLSGWGRRSLCALATLMVVAIGFSRVALAAHFVSDVIAGYLLGLAWVMVALAVFRPRVSLPDTTGPAST